MNHPTAYLILSFQISEYAWNATVQMHQFFWSMSFSGFSTCIRISIQRTHSNPEDVFCCQLQASSEQLFILSKCLFSYCNPVISLPFYIYLHCYTCRADLVTCTGQFQHTSGSISLAFIVTIEKILSVLMWVPVVFTCHHFAAYLPSGNKIVDTSSFSWVSEWVMHTPGYLIAIKCWTRQAVQYIFAL